MVSQEQAGVKPTEDATYFAIRPEDASSDSGPPVDHDGFTHEQFDNDVLQSFHDAWLQQAEPLIHDFVTPAGNPLRGPNLVELIKLDQKWRSRTAAPRPLEAYLDEWPELKESTSAVTDLLRSECKWRTVYLKGPSADEIHARFPEYAPSVDLDEINELGEELRFRESLFQSSRFFLLRRLGAGGMGIVLEVLDRELARRVALKVLPHSEPRRLSLFRKEFRTAAAITHPNLLALYELLNHSGEWFFTMELVHGEDFVSYVRHTDREDDTQDDSKADLGRLRNSLRQLAEGLNALHSAGKLHRDIKPSNVLVRPDGHVFVLDFGVAANLTRAAREGDPRDEISDDLSQDYYSTDSRTCGTRGYMSPEQEAGERLTVASDWYAVGVMLYEALVACKPVYDEKRGEHGTESRLVPPREINSDIPTDLNTLCMELLDREPTQRPTAAGILQRLSTGSEPRPETTLLVRDEALPFVGRSSQLHELREGFRDLVSGSTVTVHVSGPSGAGKTRLVEKFCGEVALRKDLARETVVLSGRCYERESVPYKALDSLVDSAVHWMQSLSADFLHSILPRNVGALAHVFPALNRNPLIHRAAETSLAVASPLELRSRAISAFRELLWNWGKHVHLVLVVDDLQWGDVESSVVLRELIRPPDPPQLLMLVSYRSDLAESNACVEALKAVESDPSQTLQSHRIDVGALSPEETRSLVELLIPAGRHRIARTTNRIVEDSGGMPFFVSELVRHAQQENPREPSAPALDDVLWTRIQKLPSFLRRFMETLAIAGQPLSVRLVAEAAAIPNFDPGDLNFLRLAHLVRTFGPGVNDDVEVFHDRIRVGIVDRLTGPRRREHHQSLAASLERSNQADPEMIAGHFHGAELPEVAGRYYELAAEQASHKLAFERAVRLYRMSMELRPVAGEKARLLHARLGAACANAGRGLEAAFEYETAANGASPTELLDLKRLAAYYYCASGHIDQGRFAFEALLERIGMPMPKTPRRALFSLLACRARLKLRGLHYRQRTANRIPPDQLTRIDISSSVAIGLTMIDTIYGADFQTRNLLLALKAGEPYRLVRALCWQATHVATAGVSAKTHVNRLLNVAKPLASQTSHPHARGLFTLASGVAAYFQGSWSVARGLCDEADHLFRNHGTGAVWELTTAQSFALWSMFFLGQTAEIVERLPRRLQSARERGDLLAEASLANLSGTLGWLALDDPRQAQEMLRHAMQPWSERAFHTQHFTSLAGQIQILLYREETPSAWQRLNSEWPALRSSLLLHIEAIRIFMRHLRARCALEMMRTGSDPANYIRSAQRDAHLIEREKAAWAKPLARLIRAALANRRGDQRQATSLLAAAASEFEAAQMGLFAASARSQCGQILGGDNGKALLSQADDWMAKQRIRDVRRMANLHAAGFQ